MALTEAEQRELDELEYEALMAEQSGEQESYRPSNQPPPDENAPSSAASGLQGFGQGATLNYLPEIQARVAQGIENVGELLGGEPADTYEQSLEYFRDQDKRMREANPLPYAGGNVAGSVATIPVGGGAAKGVGLAAKAGRAALTGGLYGLALNPEMDISNQDQYADLKARLANAGMGAALGGLGEGAIGTIGAGLRKTGERLSNTAVVKQIGANAGQVKKILQKDALPKIESFLKENGLMSAGKSVDDVAAKSREILDTDGPAIGRLYDEAQLQNEALGMSGANTKINGNELAESILNKAKQKYKTHANRDMALKEIETAVAPLRDMGDNANIVDVHAYRKSLDENIDWSKKTQERDVVQNAYIDARNIVSDKTQDTISALDKALGGKNLELLKKLNERFSQAATVNNIATQGAARESAKAFMGQGVIGGGAGLGAGALEYQRSGDPAKALGVGLATGIGVTAARKFGAPVGYYSGKAAARGGRAIEQISSRPGEVGIGTAAPWLFMQNKER